MKKVLIHYPKEQLKPTGGPSGYLYHLVRGIEAVGDSEIEINFLTETSRSTEADEGLRKLIPDWMKDIRRVLKYSNYLNRERKIEEEIYRYDAIHFHSTEDMYLSRNSLKNYQGKVILTSHSPCARHREILNRIKPAYYTLLKSKLDLLEQMDDYAFRRADYIIFPCKEAEEPYYHTWPGYRETREESKYLYLPTGIMPCHAKIKREDVRKKYEIPEEAFVVTYVGRHNQIKGYDNLKNIGEILLKNSNIYFLIAGKEEPLKGLNNPRWIEAGWTNDPHSIIASADVFLLPNKETYFDLILLEVLSLGVPVVMTRTGGNKYFEQFHSEGLTGYDSNREAIEKIVQLQSKSHEQLHALGDFNRRLYESYFTVERFSKEYLELLKEFLG